MGSLGVTEIIVILVIALIIFGPRKLPELGKTLGASLAQFRRASEDFKRTWEEEVEVEKRRLEPPPPAAVEYGSTSDPYEGHDFSLEGTPPPLAPDAINDDGTPVHIEGAEDVVPGNSSSVETNVASDQIRPSVSAHPSPDQTPAVADGAHLDKSNI